MSKKLSNVINSKVIAAVTLAALKSEKLMRVRNRLELLEEKVADGRLTGVSKKHLNDLDRKLFHIEEETVLPLEYAVADMIQGLVSNELFEAIEEAMRGTKELQEFLARFC